jgi:tetratricopeptide (TPR) repeat protein
MKKARISRLKGFVVLLVVGLVAQGAVLAGDYEAGMNYFKAGKYVEAAAEFQAIVEAAPEYDYGYFMLGLSFLQMKKHNDAISNFRKAIDINGDKPEYHVMLAQAYLIGGNYARAASTLDEAESLIGADSLVLRTVRGTANYNLGKWSAAIEDLEKAVAGEKNPSKKANAWLMIGKSYDELRNYDKAAAAYEKSNQLAADNTTMMLLALAQQNAGGQATADADKKRWYAKSMATAEALAAKAPNDFDANNTLGRAALGSENFRKAVEAFDKALALKPDYCPAMINKAKAYHFLEQWKSAESTLKKAVTGPCDGKLKAQAQEMLAYTYRRMDRLDDSLQAYNVALQMNPSSSSIKTAIKEVQTNIDVREHNTEAARKEEEARKAAEEAERKYQEEMEKRKAWEKKRDDDG